MEKYNIIDCCKDCFIDICANPCLRRYEDIDCNSGCESGGCDDFIPKRKLAKLCWLNKEGNFDVEYWDGEKITITKEETIKYPIRVGYEK